MPASTGFQNLLLGYNYHQPYTFQNKLPYMKQKSLLTMPILCSKIQEKMGNRIVIISCVKNSGTEYRHKDTQYILN